MDSASEHPVRHDRRRLAQRWDELVAEVRRSGFEDFLVPLSFDRLKACAQEGPVVVLNVAELRSDALILTPDRFEVVPLAEGLAGELNSQAAALDDALELLEEDLAAAHQGLRAVLSWLGVHLAGPVIDALGRLGFGRDAGVGGFPRLWSCPTGQLSFLPLHAAILPDGEAVFDRFSCSYAVTLRTLLEARRRAPLSQAVQALIVCVPGAPGEDSRLLHAEREAGHIADLLPGAELLSGSSARRDAVLAGLRRSSWFHFIGHARQLSLAEGGAALYCYAETDSGTGTVTAADIAELRLEHAELAVLAACESAYGDIALRDEASHLAGALQTAGFRHVVATQWTVGDRRSRRVSEDLYSSLTATAAEPLRVAEAVNDLSRRLRSTYPATSFLWAPYAHFGP